jgi:hypothetical protein
MVRLLVHVRPVASLRVVDLHGFDDGSEALPVYLPFGFRLFVAVSGCFPVKLLSRYELKESIK